MSLLNQKYSVLTTKHRKSIGQFEQGARQIRCCASKFMVALICWEGRRRFPPIMYDNANGTRHICPTGRYSHAQQSNNVC